MHRRYTSVAAVAFAASLLYGATAHPASAAQKAQVGALPDQGVATNIAGTRAYLAPPAGFNALTATDAQLAAYNFPPRPLADAPAAVHAAWEQAVAPTLKRILPTLVQSNVSSGPARSARGTSLSVSGGAVSQTSSNWSGYVVHNGREPFQNEEILQQLTVPVAQQAFGACTGSYDYGVAWAGIDGWSSPDVLQAGIEFDAYCSGGVRVPSYDAWYEWYPYNLVRIPNFAVVPGDVVRVYVWNTSSTAGHAEIINYTTQQTVSVAFSAPNGTTLHGNSVEWVVERPGVNGGLATLTNYVADPFTFTEAFNTKGSTTVVNTPGSAPSGSLYAVTMLDNSGNPISISELQGLWDLWFYDEGSAY